MRYAPTCLLFVRRGVGALLSLLVRSRQGVCDTPLHVYRLFVVGVDSLHFGLVRAFEGVCDTPLHVYRLFVVGLGRCISGLFAHVRAYAIRPYMFTVCSWWGWFVAFRAGSLT